MAGGAGIRHLVFDGHRWSDELEGVRTHKRSGDTLGRNLRHVAGDTLAARTSVFTMSMLFQGRGVWAVWGRWAGAVQADLLRRFAELRIILGAVHIMA